MKNNLLLVLGITIFLTVTTYAQEVTYSFNTIIPEGIKYVTLRNVRMKVVNIDTEAVLTLKGDVLVFRGLGNSVHNRVYYFMPYDNTNMFWFIVKPIHTVEKPFYGRMTPGGAVLAAEEVHFASFTSKTILFEVQDSGKKMQFILQLEDE